jgi:hypothetical protein
MRRHDNWPTLLAAFIEERRHSPFAWGSNDCCLFAADWVLQVTGHDIAQKFRGHYNSALGAQRFVAEGGGVENLIANVGAQRLPALLAQRGDLVSMDNGEGVALGVCVGHLSAFVGKKGLHFFNHATPAANCWRF